MKCEHRHGGDVFAKLLEMTDISREAKSALQCGFYSPYEPWLSVTGLRDNLERTKVPEKLWICLVDPREKMKVGQR